MRATQKKMMSKPVTRTEVGRNVSEFRRFFRASPAWRMAIARTKTRYRARPRPAMSLRSPASGCASCQAVRDKDIAVLVVPCRNPVAPPQLARNAPVLDVFEPLVVGVVQFSGHELDLADSPPTSRPAPWPGLPSLTIPLVGEHRLDDRVGAVAPRHHQLVRLGFNQQTLRFEVGDDFLAGVETVQALVLRRAPFVDLRIERQDAERNELVALADLVVVEIVRRRDFHAAGAEFADRRSRRR